MFRNLKFISKTFMNSEVIHVLKQIGMKAYGEIRVYLHSFFTLGCRRWLSGECSASSPDIGLLFVFF
jgi:hypothetical protein